MQKSKTSFAKEHNAQQELTGVVKNFLDVEKIIYSMEETKSVSRFIFEKSERSEIPDYHVLIEVCDSIFKDTPYCLRLNIIYPVSIDEQRRISLLEFASRINDMCSVGYFTMTGNFYAYRTHICAVSIPTHPDLQRLLNLAYVNASMFLEEFFDVALGGLNPHDALN